MCYYLSKQKAIYFGVGLQSNIQEEEEENKKRFMNKPFFGERHFFLNLKF
jgi:hypothetical protein